MIERRKARNLVDRLRRFSRRTWFIALCVITLAVALVLAEVRARWQRTPWRRDAAALAELQKQIGSGEAMAVGRFEIEPKGWGPEWLYERSHVQMVEMLEFKNLRDPDRVIPDLRAFRELVSIRFVGTAPTPTGLRKIGNLNGSPELATDVAEVCLHDCNLSRAHFRAIRDFRVAFKLSLRGSRFDEESLLMLCENPEPFALEGAHSFVLDLRETPVTLEWLGDLYHTLRANYGALTIRSLVLSPMDFADPEVLAVLTQLDSLVFVTVDASWNDVPPQSYPTLRALKQFRLRDVPPR